MPMSPHKWLTAFTRSSKCTFSFITTWKCELMTCLMPRYCSRRKLLTASHPLPSVRKVQIRYTWVWLMWWRGETTLSSLTHSRSAKWSSITSHTMFGKRRSKLQWTKIFSPCENAFTPRLSRLWGLSGLISKTHNSWACFKGWLYVITLFCMRSWLTSCLINL